MKRRIPAHQISRPRAGLERRLTRSEQPEKALCLLLDAARKRQGYSALAVADTSGLLVAGSGHFADCEELAAYAPLFRNRHASRRASSEGREVECLTVDGVSVLITGVDALEPGLDAVVAGCSRILGRPKLQPSVRAPVH